MTETMRIQQGYKYRIYPTKAQEMKLRQVLGTKRFVYNHFLAKRQQHYEETGQGMSYKSLFDYSNNALYILCVGANLCVRPFGSAQSSGAHRGAPLIITLDYISKTGSEDCANELPALLAAGSNAIKGSFHANKKARNRVNGQGAKWRTSP